MKNHTTIIGINQQSLFSALKLLEHGHSVSLIDQKEKSEFTDFSPPEWIPKVDKHHPLKKYIEILLPDHTLVYSEITAKEMNYYKKNHQPMPPIELEKLIFRTLRDIEDQHLDHEAFQIPLTGQSPIYFSNDPSSHSQQSLFYGLHQTYGSITPKINDPLPTIETGGHFALLSTHEMIANILTHLKNIARNGAATCDIYFGTTVKHINKHPKYLEIETSHHFIRSNSALIAIPLHAYDKLALNHHCATSCQQQQEMTSRHLIFYKSDIPYKKKYLFIETEQADAPLLFINNQAIDKEQPRSLTLIQLKTPYSESSLMHALKYIEDCISLKATDCDFEKTRQANALKPLKICTEQKHEPPLFFLHKKRDFLTSIQEAIENSDMIHQYLSKPH